MNKLEVMLDLETMSTKPNAAIIAIGAVRMDLTNMGIVDEFYCNIQLADSSLYGDIDPGTVEWWMQQSEDARQRLFTGTRMKLAPALMGFAQWFGEPAPLWGNGAGFDNVVLRHSYLAASLMVPWRYTHDRCYRTLKNLVPSAALEPPANTQKHDALADAKWQAEHLINMMNYLKGANV